MHTKDISSESNLINDQVFQLLESLPDATCLIDRSGVILNLNTLFASLLPKEPQQCIGENIYSLIETVLKLPELAVCHREKTEEVLHSGKRSAYETKLNNWKVTINPLLSPEQEITRLCVSIQDNSEQQRLEHELQNERSLKTALLQAIPGFAVIIDSEGQVIGWNHYTHDIIFGKQENEMRNIDFSEFVYPDDMNFFRKKFLAILNSGVETSCEARVRPHGKDYSLWLLINAKRVIIDARPCVIAIGTNITERKRIETELIESKKRFSYALDAAHSGIWEWNVITDELSWSDQVWTLCGLDVKSAPLNHQLCVQIVHPDDREVTSRIIRDAVSKETSASPEYRVCYPDGSIHWLVSRGMPLHDTDGKLMRYIGTIIDITERKKIELALLESKAQLNQALEAARAGMWEWNLETNDNIWSNEIWTLYGLEPSNEKPSFQLWVNSIHPDDREMAIKTVTEAARNGLELNVEYRVCHPDGSIHWLMSRGKPFTDDKGQKIRYIGTAIDITERKETEIALRENKTRFTFALEATNAGVWEWDVKADKVTWSDQIWALYGLELNCMPPSHKLCASTVHHDDWDMTFQKIMAAVNHGGEVNVEYRVCHRDDSIHWLTCRGMPVYDTDGEISCYIGTVMDITDRKNAEQKISESKAKLEAALASMSDAVFISDPSGNFNEFNNAFATFHRFHSKEECAKNLDEYLKILDVFMPDGTLAPKEQWAVSRALRGESATNTEYSLRRKDTGETWVGSFSFAPIRDKTSKTVGSVVSGRDITEQKLAETAIKESELKFRSIFDYAPFAIAIAEIQNDRLLDVNTSWLKLFGYTKAEVLNCGISELNLYEDNNERERIIRTLNEKSRIINQRLKLRKKNGEFIDVLYSGKFITLDNQSLLLVMMTDITIQELQQENIIKLESIVADRTQQLKEEVERLHRFLSMISHEYRTPLAILRVNLDLIELKNKNGIYENHKEINKIQRAINRLVEVMDVSIQESRILESQQTDMLMCFNIEPIIASQIDAFQALWPEYSIRYFEPVDKCEIFGDSSQLKLAIFNLLDNARKYSIPNFPIDVDCRCESEEVVITIRNKGKSITPEEGERYFEKYLRGKHATNTAGAGLGLWLVRNIINRHNGQVTLTGIPSGVEATIRLPLVKKER
ncbi:MAG: PAS domain S-box protein [Chlorobium sp.]|nr:MAG: PAS domain S-box protein [Chlorobium sp.]